MTIAASTWFGIGIAGALGALLRTFLSIQFPIAAGAFPWTTFTINILGSFILGLAATSSQLRDHLPLLQIISFGFLGAFTTFSTFSMETFHLIQNDRLGLAILLAVFSVVCGAGAAMMGAKLWA